MMFRVFSFTCRACMTDNGGRRPPAFNVKVKAPQETYRYAGSVRLFLSIQTQIVSDNFFLSDSFFYIHLIICLAFLC